MLLIIISSCLTPLLFGSKMVELTARDVRVNLDTWTSDMTIMFYAPWCKACKEMLPHWNTIADGISLRSSHIIVGKFNCEYDSASEELCHSLLIRQYPSIGFIGYGDMNQADGGAIAGRKRTFNRSVLFDADLYIDAIYDWIQTLSTVSYAQRQLSSYRHFFPSHWFSKRPARGGGVADVSDDDSKVKELENSISNLNAKVTAFSSELEKYRALEQFDRLKDYGDPFPLLHSDNEGNEDGEALRQCVAEMAAEYCKYVIDQTDEPFCKMIIKCQQSQMKPLECRPKSCPFLSPRGCKVVSTCGMPEVVAQFKLAS